MLTRGESEVKVILQHPPSKAGAAESKNMASIISSRDNWKRKAMERGRLNKNLVRQNARIRLVQSELIKRENLLSKERDALAEELRCLRLLKPIQHQSTTMILSVMLVLNARIPFRAVPRVLSCVHFQGWIPHFSSTINWVCRVGLASLRYMKAPKEAWIAIVDMTIDVAFSKALVVLRVPLSIYTKKVGAITLEDVSCAGVVVGRVWKSVDIAQALHGILDNEPNLIAIIKDAGNDLCKAVRLWQEESKRDDVVTISDISHEAANALKQDFDTKESFLKLKEKLNKNSTKIFQSSLSYLAPPRLRVKGRYMGISKLARWFGRIQILIGGAGRAKKGSVTSELRRMFGGMGKLRNIADEFCRRSVLLADVMAVLKLKGLNTLSFNESMKKIEMLPKDSASRTRMEKWLKNHLEIQRQLNVGETPLVVTSDIIESLFGAFKYFIARNPKCELNHLVLAMPALCGPQSEQRISHQLNQVSHADLKEWKKKEIAKTARMKRSEIMAEIDSQNSEQKWGHLRSV